DAYLRGRALAEYADIPEKLEAARQQFEQALEADPEFAPALAGLSRVESAYYRNLDPSADRLQLAEQLARRALALDPDLPEAHFALGYVYGEPPVMRRSAQIGRFAATLALGLAAAEVVIMISPFAGLFYGSLRFEPFLGFFSQSALTAWLDGFFLNHAVVTNSALLEWQRKIGLFLFALGLWGFFLSGFQVYGNKILKRGVAKGLLYRFVRHPQYLCLGIAGWGLLTWWPRFLLLGIWVTMLCLYAALARFEERRLEERFGEDYRRFGASRGAFLPRSPMRRLFEATFGRLRARPLGWAAAYVFCLTLAFSLGFALRAYTRASTTILFQPEQQTVIVSTWPQPEEWAAKVFQAALTDEQVQERLEEARGNQPVVATILPAQYVMTGMYYKEGWGLRGEGGTAPGPSQLTMAGFSFTRLMRIASFFLVPIEGVTYPEHFWGVDPDVSNDPVEVVFSRAAKPYKDDLALEEALDPGVRLTPLVIVDVLPATGEVTRVRVPLPQNAWGPNVVMPLL
ncbi:MAG: methyltransferase, partial [Terriglobia bacterium]